MALGDGGGRCLLTRQSKDLLYWIVGKVVFWFLFFRTKTEKIKRIKGDRAENSRAAGVQAGRVRVTRGPLQTPSRG